METKDIDKILSYSFKMNDFKIIKNKQKVFENFKKAHGIIRKNKKFPEYFRYQILERIGQVVEWRNTLQELRKTPLIEQKSPEWYKMRENMAITASDLAQSLNRGDFGNQTQIIMEKAYNVKRVFNEHALKAMQWGNKYEPVAIKIYEHMFNTIVHEFGLMQNPNFPFFGASPDGISELGVMLEIKCPFFRKKEILPVIKEQYYYQIQGQLNTCNLDQCDYFECYIKEFDDRNDFFRDLEQCSQYGGKNKDFVGNQVFYGIIIQKYINEDIGEKESDYSLNDLYLKYSPAHFKYDDLLLWEQTNINYKECSNNYTKNWQKQGLDTMDRDEEELQILMRLNKKTRNGKKQKLDNDSFTSGSIDDDVNESEQSEPKYKIIYWKCHSHYLTAVKRDDVFFTQVMNDFQDFNKQIQYYKNHYALTQKVHSDHQHLNIN